MKKQYKCRGLCKKKVDADSMITVQGKRYCYKCYKELCK